VQNTIPKPEEYISHFSTTLHSSYQVASVVLVGPRVQRGTEGLGQGGGNLVVDAVGRVSRRYAKKRKKAELLREKKKKDVYSKKKRMRDVQRYSNIV